MGDIIYVTQPDGTKFKGCSCIQQSWLTITRLAVAKGLIKRQIRVTQGSYNTSVSASASTHKGGGVLDVGVTGRALDTLLEECGIAAYERTEADGFTPHSHILWIGCPHLDPSAAKQVTSWKNKRNGLRSNALDRDTTRPSPIRDWKQGLAWAKEQLAILEDDMPLTTSEIDAIANRVWSATLGTETAGDRLARAANMLSAFLGSSGPTVGVALQGTYWNTSPITRGGEEVSLRQEVADSKTMLLALTAAQKDAINEEALAAMVAQMLAPILKDAVVEAVNKGGEADTIADQVTARVIGAFKNLSVEGV